jgi:energy-coupling factor transport system permease protein
MNLGARQSFGRYIALESPLHALDPFIKILLFGTVIISVLLATAWLHLAFLAAYVFVLCLLSRVRLLFYLDSLKYFSWMFALSFAINVIFPRGDRALAFSFDALSVAGIFSVRLVLMILAATLLTVVTCPSEIGDSILVLARLRGRIGRRAAEFASLISISLRFVPVMFEEAERILAAQRLRGRPAKGLTGRVRSVVGLIIPLIDSSMRRATNLGFALEARCYGYRVPHTPGLRLGRYEIIIGGSGLLVLVAMIMMR